MRPSSLLVLLTLLVGVLFLGVTIASANGQTEQFPNQAGGGLLTGSVLGFNMWDQLIPIPWAPITASNGQMSFSTSTGGGGYYEMFVPVGRYNVTVATPGYTAQSILVSVPNGSTSNINFYLYQSGVPVPEFPLGIVSLIMIAALTGALLAKKATKGTRK